MRKDRKKRTPRFARTFLKRLVEREIREAMLTDLDAAFREQCAAKGRLFATLWYWKQIAGFFPKTVSNHIYWGSFMLTNYFKSVIRHFQKSKIFSFINLAGLTVGLTCSLLILIYVRYELSYDRYLPRAQRIHRVIMRQPFSVYQGTDLFNRTPAILKPFLDSEIPEIEISARMDITYNCLLTIGEHTFSEYDGFILADPQWLDLFDIALESGQTGYELTEPYTVLISQSAAAKHFGADDPVGHFIRMDHKTDYKIIGVFRDIPANSHFTYDFIASFQTLYSESPYDIEDWNGNNVCTYVLTRKDADSEKIDRGMASIVKAHYDPDIETRFLTQPLTSIHLGGNINFEIAKNSDIRLLYIFSAVGFFILAIAGLNYMNLATARSLRRSREVGLRKVLGASRKNLTAHFLGESLFYALAGLAIALLLVQMLLPGFGNLVNRQLPMSLAFTPATLLMILGLTLVSGLLAGLYPALYLSSFQPVSIFRGTNRQGKDQTRRLRNGLVLIQFILSAGLISGTLIMQKQMAYIRSKELGYRKDHVFTAYISDLELRKNIRPILQELRTLPGVLAVTGSGDLPATVSSSCTAQWENQPEGMEINNMYRMRVDENTLDFYNIRLIDGRGFSRERPSELKNGYIVNETAARSMGMEHPVGKELRLAYNDDRPGTIIGVVEDFHFHSLHQPVGPVTLHFVDDMSQYNGIKFISLRIHSEEMTKTIAAIKQIIDRHTPRFPTYYEFLDDRVQRLYRDDRRLTRAFNLFSGLAIFIACLGLVGLASFTIDLRARELSIRKVLGASTATLTLMLLKSFIQWIWVANLLAVPLIWVIMGRWLHQFSYRTKLGPGVFILAAGISLAVAVLTVGAQTLRAARAKPAEVLGRET